VNEYHVRHYASRSHALVGLLAWGVGRWVRFLWLLLFFSKIIGSGTKILVSKAETPVLNSTQPFEDTG